METTNRAESVAMATCVKVSETLPKDSKTLPKDRTGVWQWNHKKGV